MKTIGFRRFGAVLLFFCCLFLGFGCGKKGGNEDSLKPPQAYTPGKTTVLVPEAPGTVTTGEDPLILDFSNAGQGYFMGKLTQPDTKINIQITGSDNVCYKYFLTEADSWTAFPITAGNGTYLVLAYQEISDGQYASLFSYSLNVTLDSEFYPFLYPNQYVNFTSDSKAISLAASLTKDAAEDLDALDAIYQYVTTHITYDSDKAATVGTGYLPDIDETLRTGTGICFDYAALTASMLRSLSIPARLDIGYSGDVRHAWVDVYIESVGWVKRAVEFNGNEWKMIDPTFAAAAGNEDNEAIDEYIGDSSNYTVQYIR